MSEEFKRINKQKYLDIAEIVDAWRVIPRLMLAGYFWFYTWYIVHVTHWYFELPATGIPDTAFVTGTITALGGMGTFFMNAYLQSGRKWG